MSDHRGQCEFNPLLHFIQNLESDQFCDERKVHFPQVTKQPQINFSFLACGTCRIIFH